jgi:hypothetical protein
VSPSTVGQCVTEPARDSSGDDDVCVQSDDKSSPRAFTFENSVSEHRRLESDTLLNDIAISNDTNKTKSVSFLHWNVYGLISKINDNDCFIP